LQTQLDLLTAPGCELAPVKRSRHSHCSPVAAVVTTTNFERGFTRGAGKREAARSVEFALQLCEVSKRQMPKIQAALTEQLSDAIAIAQNIPKTNQARKRQINLIAKLLRQLEDEELQNIKVLANGLENGFESSFEIGANNLADNWMTGLLMGDKATNDTMNSFPGDWLDSQLIRHLTRRCQQLAETPSSSDMTEEDGAPQRKDPALKKAEKQLRKELRILAARHLQEGTAEEPHMDAAEKEEEEFVWVR